MKRYLILLMLACLSPIACSISSTVDVEATVQAAIAATGTAMAAAGAAPPEARPPAQPSQPTPTARSAPTATPPPTSAPAWSSITTPTRASTPTPTAKPTRTFTPRATATRVPSPTATLRPPAPPTATPPPPAPPTATPEPLPAFRPPTGLLASGQGGGSGELLVKNGTEADALVIVTSLADQPVMSAYIRAAESFNMTGIPDGTYRLYFSKGEGWDSDANRFIRNVSYQRFESVLEFVTTATQYTGYEVTLYGVAGGTASTEQVDPSQFPGLP